MAVLTLKKKPTNVLKVNIGDDTFSIPLRGSLTPAEAAPLNTQAGTIAFLQKHLSDEVIEVLTIDDYNQITAAWIKASNEASGKTAGES